MQYLLRMSCHNGGVGIQKIPQFGNNCFPLEDQLFLNQLYRRGIIIPEKTNKRISSGRHDRNGAL
jgi:hypothetical protein